jgi:predicted dehydrogenase
MATTSPAGLRTAIVGLGRMGMRHLQVTRELKMSVCGVADLAETALDAARSEHGIGSSVCFRDACEMFRTVRPEAVVVATTAPSHAELVLAAVENGARFILCEKPMASSLAEADRMLETCRRSGVVLAINHQMQFMPHYRRMKALIGTDELGPLVSILVAAANIGLAMNVSHYFEMFRYVTGGEPVQCVSAWLEPDPVANPRGVQFEDRSGRLLARGVTGTSMFVDFSADAGHGLQIVYIYRHGQVSVDELSGDIRVVARKEEYRELPTTRYGMPADARHETVQPIEPVLPTMELWSAMLGGKDYPDGRAGAHALACCVAAHVSHEAGGREVRIDDATLPRDRLFKWA